MRQVWWKDQVPADWVEGVKATPEDVYRNLCIDMAERRITREQVAMQFCHLIADCLRQWQAKGVTNAHLP